MSDNCFTAVDGKQYAFDTWYPWPFELGGLAMLPVRTDSPLTERMFYKTEDEKEYLWTVFAPLETRQAVRVSWCIKKPIVNENVFTITERLERLKRQVDYSISIVQQGLVKDPSVRRSPNIFRVGDFEIMDLSQ